MSGRPARRPNCPPEKFYAVPPSHADSALPDAWPDAVPAPRSGLIIFRPQLRFAVVHHGYTRALKLRLRSSSLGSLVVGMTGSYRHDSRTSREISPLITPRDGDNPYKRHHPELFKNKTVK